jgi:hypothetical protein
MQPAHDFRMKEPALLRHVHFMTEGEAKDFAMQEHAKMSASHQLYQF